MVQIVFRNVKELTTEELQKELHAIELFKQEIDNVNVENMLNKSVDTSFLGPLKCTLTLNRQLFRIDKQGFLPAMMQRMYDDRVLYKTKMIDAQKELEKVTAKLKELT